MGKLDRRWDPGDLMDFAAETAQLLIDAGVGGFQMLEQGCDWVTWSIPTEAMLLKATNAVMGRSYLKVQMRYSLPGERELYIER